MADEKLRIIRNVVLEINFDLTMGGEAKVTAQDKKTDVKDKETLKQIMKIENISYKEPNDDEMGSYWKDLVLGKKSSQSDEVNYTGSDESELERWRDEFLKAYLGRRGEDLIKRLRSKNIWDNYSNYHLIGKEKEELLKQIALRLSSIKDIENISDFQSKSDIALKDLKISLIIIDSELSGRTKCFLNNEDMKREKGVVDKDSSKFFVSKKIDKEKINKAFQHPKFKKQTNIEIILKLVKSILDKLYGENVYNPYRIKDNDFEKKNVKVFFITDVAEYRKKKHPVFLAGYIIKFVYDEFGMTVKDVSIESVDLKDMVRNVKTFVSKNSEKMGVEKESKNLIFRKRLIKYILR